MSAGEIWRVILHKHTSNRNAGRERQKTACHLFALIQDRIEEGIWGSVCVSLCVCGGGGGGRVCGCRGGGTAAGLLSQK